MVADYRDAIVDMDLLLMIDLDVFSHADPNLTVGFGLLCTQISPETQFYLPPVNVLGEFGLIFIFENIYAHLPWSHIETVSLCPDQLQISESFAVPEDNKWCVVMTLRNDRYPLDSNFGPVLSFRNVFTVYWIS
jgi:hypothetical protein